jgi:hypothetical protein
MANVRKIRVHCENYINAAENIGRGTDKMAKYREMR